MISIVICICEVLFVLKNAKLLAMHNLIYHYNNAVKFLKKYWYPYEGKLLKYSCVANFITIQADRMKVVLHITPKHVLLGTSWEFQGRMNSWGQDSPSCLVSCTQSLNQSKRHRVGIWGSECEFWVSQTRHFSILSTVTLGKKLNHE